MSYLKWIAIAAIGLTAVGCAQTDPHPEESRPPVAAKPLMGELVVTQYGKLLSDLSRGPAGPEEWERSAVRAALLVEAGDILMRSESAQEDSWRIAASALHDGGNATRAAIDVQDLTAARIGFEKLSTACSSCHHECGAAYRIPWQSQ